MASVRSQKFWKKLAQWYGARLADNYGPKCPQEWCAVIDRTDDERLDKALAAIRRQHVQYPPTLGQFETAIPEKQQVEAGPSVAQQLANFVAENRRPCRHQKLMPWSYFGPMREWNGTHRKETLKHPEIAGVVVPACHVEQCEDGGGHSFRVKVADMEQTAA